MGFNSFLSYRIRFVIYFTTLQAICTKSPEYTSERVCTALNELLLWMRSSCNNVQKQLNSKWTAFYYNVMYMTVRVIVINIIVVCPARDACRRDHHRITTMKRFYCNSTKFISDEINSSRPIYTIYKVVKMFLNNLYPTRKLQRFKSLPPCSSVSQNIGVVGFIHAC